MKLIITEEEKSRILGMHQSATSRQYLKEETTIKNGAAIAKWTAQVAFQKKFPQYTAMEGYIFGVTQETSDGGKSQNGSVSAPMSIFVSAAGLSNVKVPFYDVEFNMGSYGVVAGNPNAIFIDNDPPRSAANNKVDMNYIANAVSKVSQDTLNKAWMGADPRLKGGINLEQLKQIGAPQKIIAMVESGGTTSVKPATPTKP